MINTSGFVSGFASRLLKMLSIVKFLKRLTIMVAPLMGDESIFDLFNGRELQFHINYVLSFDTDFSILWNRVARGKLSI